IPTERKQRSVAAKRVEDRERVGRASGLECGFRLDETCFHTVGDHRRRRARRILGLHELLGEAVEAEASTCTDAISNAWIRGSTLCLDITITGVWQTIGSLSVCLTEAGNVRRQRPRAVVLPSAGLGMSVDVLERSWNTRDRSCGASEVALIQKRPAQSHRRERLDARSE